MPIVNGNDGTVLVIGGLGDLVVVGGNYEDKPESGFVELMPLLAKAGRAKRSQGEVDVI